MAAAIASMLAIPSVSHAAPLLLAEPSRPGETQPASGQSLFDDLFKTGGGHVLPFPFERLTAAVEKANGGIRPRAVLVPMGRSLQRLAADPDYFASPRVVVGIDASGSESAHYVKDRLFIGYQAKSASMEVISYNETMGRFEFQVVSNYDAARKPLVEYAERSVCTACHQGHGPIFPIAQWNETNANPEIAARMAGLGASFHGVPVRRGIDEPDALDQAVARANRLILVPFVWRRLCAGAPGFTPAECRNRLLLAALRWRLGGARGPWRSADDADLAAALHAGLRKLAPDGIAVPNPSIPDRNPLTELDAGVKPMDVVEPDGVYDPALSRAARVLTQATDTPADILALAVASIGESFPPGVVGAIDLALSKRAGPKTQFGAACTIQRVLGETRFECDDRALMLSGYNGPGGGMVSRLALQGHAPLGALKVGPGMWLIEGAHGLSARLATGERLSPLRLGEGRVEIAVTDDIGVLRRAVSALDPTGIEAAPLGFAPSLMIEIARQAP